MTDLMKALVKVKPEPGIWMEYVPRLLHGPNDVLIRISKTASVALTCISTIGMTGRRRRYMCPW